MEGRRYCDDVGRQVEEGRWTWWTCADGMSSIDLGDLDRVTYGDLFHCSCAATSVGAYEKNGYVGAQVGAYLHLLSNADVV